MAAAGHTRSPRGGSSGTIVTHMRVAASSTIGLIKNNFYPNGRFGIAIKQGMNLRPGGEGNLSTQEHELLENLVHLPLKGIMNLYNFWAKLLLVLVKSLN